jgi:AcrR family transcriptional regulator
MKLRRPYHHGDLRQALVDAAIDLLRESGPEALTLRGAARAAGVSQAAPYRHFKDRRALVAAVADDGFRRLRLAMSEGASLSPPKRGARKRQSPRDPASGLRHLAVEYVRFAHEHPAEYRVMFGAEILTDDDYAELRASSRAVFDLLSGGIAALQERGIIRKGDPDTIAIGAWAMMHGLVMLSLDRQVTVAAKPLDELVMAVTDLLMNGMAAPR